MKIGFNDIVGQELKLKITEAGWFPGEELNLECSPDGMVSLSRKTDTHVEVAGSFSAAALSECSRCCQQARIELAADFRYDCIVGEEAPDTRAEAECRAEDYFRLYLKEPVIDLGEILREQILLAMPVRILCSTSCRGLCPRCGIDLNMSDCNCDDTAKASSFDVLKKLKGR